MSQAKQVVANARETALNPVEEMGWRPRTYVIGGLIGGVLGLLSAFLYVKSVENQHGADFVPEPPSAGDSVRLGVSLLSIVRTITDWGTR
jgi:hypothetical protein